MNTHRNRTLDELEKKHRETVGKKRPMQRYRQVFEILRDILEDLREPQLLYKVLYENNSPRNKLLLFKLTEEKLIKPSEYEKMWVITDKGKVFLEHLDNFLKTYPFVTQIVNDRIKDDIRNFKKKDNNSNKKS